MVLSDLDIGMNDWMIPELKWDDSYKPDRGKVLTSDDVEKMEKFYRYLDTDGDGIAARTLPGENPKGAYFVRGSGHNKHGMYTESSEEYTDLVDRLLVKWETAKSMVPEAVLSEASQPTRLGIVAFGSSDGAVIEARDRLAEQGIKRFGWAKVYTQLYDSGRTHRIWSPSGQLVFEVDTGGTGINHLFH